MLQMFLTKPSRPQLALVWADGKTLNTHALLVGIMPVFLIHTNWSQALSYFVYLFSKDLTNFDTRFSLMISRSILKTPPYLVFDYLLIILKGHSCWMDLQGHAAWLLQNNFFKCQHWLWWQRPSIEVLVIKKIIMDCHWSSSWYFGCTQNSALA